MSELRHAGRATVTLLASLAWAMIGTHPVAADQIHLDPGANPRIVNGLTTHAYPTTGALLYAGGLPATADNASLHCSGTLIGCSTFLTAAHCVGSDTDGSHFLVYLQHAGLFAVTSVAAHPGTVFPVADVAVLKLADPVTGIAPSAINLIDPVPHIPAAGTIVGFGQSQGNANDYGIKRVGGVETLSCSVALPQGASDTELVCWDFLAPIGPAGVDSNTCNGDSGGPIFLDLGAGQTVAGVTSGGTSSFCLPTDHSYDASVFTYSGFILAQRGGDATGPCGGLPPVGDAQVSVAAFDGALGAGHPSDSYTVPVPAGKNAVRFALNGEDNGAFDLDMYVKAGPGASPASFDCKADGGSVFGDCVFNLPVAASYSVFIVGVGGSGDYQLTVTTFGGAPPVCGNGSRDFNEQCDGPDDARCDGLCQPDCTCPQPVCGNGVREQSEGCDGSDSPQCPGQCQLDCTCPVPCQSGGLVAVRLRATAQHLRFRGTVENYFGEFDGRDPRNGFTLLLTQGASTVTVDIPAADPGWSGSDPARGRFKWRGDLNGVTRINWIDRPTKGVLKLLVGGRVVPGAGAIDTGQAIDATLTIDGQCEEQTF